MAVKYFNIPFATGGDKNAIPDTDPGAGEVNYTDGFGTKYAANEATDPSALNIERPDANGLFFNITDLLKEVQETGVLPYGAVYNYLIGAYVSGSNGLLYRCALLNGPATSPVDPVGDLTGTWVSGSFLTSPAAVNVYRSGLLWTQDTDELFTIGVGNASDSSGATDLALTVALQKQADSTWVVGDGNGAMPSALTGPIAGDTWYRLFIIKNVATGAVDLGLDTSDAAVNLLADATGYTLYRRIGWVFLDSALNITPFLQSAADPTRYTWVTLPSVTISPVANASRAAVTFSDEAPPSTRLRAALEFIPNEGGRELLVTTVDQADTAPSTINFTVRVTTSVSDETRGAEILAEWELDSSQEIYLRADTFDMDDSDAIFVVEGWRDSWLIA